MVNNFFYWLFIFLGTLLFVQSLEICDMQLPASSQDIYACPSKDCILKKCDYRCNKRNRDHLPIMMNITDAENGILEVVYKLNNQSITEFTMELFVSETATAEECKKGISSNMENWKLHSRRTESMKWCDSSDCQGKCESILTVTFDYIYTSCYYISVARKYGTKSHQTLASCSQMLETKTIKKKLSEMTPEVAPRYHPGEGARYTAHIDGTPRVIWVTLSSEFSKDGESKCQKCLNSHSCCVYNRDYNYNNYKNNSFICEDHNYSEAKCTLTKSARPGLESVNCLFHNVTPGNYCISIMYSDDRCIFSPTIWGDGMCHWTTALNVKYHAIVGEPALQQNDVQSFYLLIITMALLFILIMIFGIVIFWRRKPDKPVCQSQTEGEKFEYQKLFRLSNQKVVLLSPYSCEPLMDCVAKLREVLKSKNCEVFDYWDPDMYLSVVRSPTFWLESLLRDKSVQIIVVASECSRLLEKNRNLQYKNPHCLDSLFTFGLESIKTFIADSYEKIYVVSFLGEQYNSGNKSNGLSFVNPLTVYTLPTNLEKLILALHSIDGFGYSIEMNTPEVQKFTSAVDTYSELVSINPNYVDDLFIVNNGHQRWKT